jgi:hypothetical protein
VACSFFHRVSKSLGIRESIDKNMQERKADSMVQLMRIWEIFLRSVPPLSQLTNQDELE